VWISSQKTHPHPQMKLVNPPKTEIPHLNAEKMHSNRGKCVYIGRFLADDLGGMSLKDRRGRAKPGITFGTYRVGNYRCVAFNSDATKPWVLLRELSAADKHNKNS